MESIRSKTFLKERVIEYFQKLPSFFLHKDVRKKILIGFSGGPDSVSLMTILYELRGSLNIDISLCYFNHKIRPDDELEAEMDFIKDIAKKYDLPLIIGIDRGEIERYSGEIGVECSARKARYEFFERAFKETESDFLALAHNLDDTVETLVMRFFKGSGLAGLRGIPPERDNIIRPFSKCPKSTILSYLKENDLSFSIDKTNYGTDYLRNRVRNVLLPKIKEVFPACFKTLPELSEKICMAYDFIKEETEKRIEWKKIEYDGGFAYATDYASFADSPEAVKLESLYSCFDTFAKGKYRELPYKFLKNAVKEKMRSGRKILLKGYGFTVRREGNLLIWKEDIVNKAEKSYLFTINDAEKMKNRKFFALDGNRGFSVEKSLLSLCNRDDIWIPLSGAGDILTVRPWKEGDSIMSGKYRKKIKKIFSDWKVPQEKRKDIPVICNREGVAAVWGSFCGFKDRVSDSVRIDSGDMKEREVYIFKIRQDDSVR